MSLEKWAINSTRTAVVSTDTFWIPIDEHTPFGVKCLVIDDKQRIAYLREVWPSGGWTHWHPLPKFREGK